MPTKKSTPVSEWQTSWFRFKLADGRVVVAPAHGAGGLFRGAHGEKQIRRAIRAAEAGEPTGYYEPKPGHMLVWPQYSFADNGPEMTIPLAGATVRLVKATRERTRAHKAGKAALGPDDWAAKPVHHATRKRSPAQLDREIAEALSQSPKEVLTDERINEIYRDAMARGDTKTAKLAAKAAYAYDKPQEKIAALAVHIAKHREQSAPRFPKGPGRRSHATKKPTSTGGAHQKWNVYSGGKLITSVFYVPSVDADEVRRGLINHDGYPDDIRVRRGARR